MTDDLNSSGAQEVRYRHRLSTMLLLGVVVLLLLAVLPVAVFTVRPVGCSNCHNDPVFVSNLEKYGHTDSPCLACHSGTDLLGRVEFGARQAYVMVIPIVGASARDGGVTYDERCESCHSDLTGVVERDGIRVAHDSCAVDAACIDCHGGSTHGAGSSSWVNSYSMDGCLTCHGTRKEGSECDLCHEGKRQRDRVSTGPWAVTHGPEWQSTHGMGDTTTCEACHERTLCSKCHGIGVPHGVDFADRHGELAQAAAANCESCHRADFCATVCHEGYRMPHPADFVDEHADQVDAEGPQPCLNCHKSYDCDTCHEAHVHPGGAIGRAVP